MPKNFVGKRNTKAKLGKECEKGRHANCYVAKCTCKCHDDFVR